MSTNFFVHRADLLRSQRLRVILSLVVVWSVAYLGPSRESLAGRIAAQVSRLPSVRINYHPERTPRHNYDAQKLALLFGPEPKGQITPLLLHTMAVAPPEWPFTFIGSAESVELVNRSTAIKQYQSNGKLALVEAPPELGKLDSEGIHRALTMSWFYDNMVPGVEHLFHFDVGSIICANANSTLNDWLDYDWIAPPWEDYKHHGSSGGFSLRRVSKIKHVLSFQERANDTIAEDDFFTQRLQSLPDAKLASEEAAARFGVERKWYPTPMGFKVGDMGNAGDVWNDESQRKQVWEYCPELKIVTSMKLMREKCD